MMEYWDHWCSIILSKDYAAPRNSYPLSYHHLIVTAGGLSLDGKRWIEIDPNASEAHKKP
jgi:hypothetical protein